MTLHQLHYTSCDDGVEGIQGFQVSAVSAHAPRQLSDLAVRLSVYDLGAEFDAAAEPGPDLPLAFGYSPAGRGAVLFQSRYAGADFTGRLGNYFAHAVLADDADEALGQRLPISLWRSPLWRERPSAGTELPVLADLPTGQSTVDVPPSAVAVRLLTEVQRALAAGSGKVVLVVADADRAAAWIAAATRSFPRALAMAISFVTYTARPDRHDALLACTTPGTRLPDYGDFTVVDTQGDGSGRTPPSAYARMLCEAWEAGEVADVLAMADLLGPPLKAADLDDFAAAVYLVSGLGPAPADEPALLAALDTAVGRLPRPLGQAAWNRVAATAEAVGLSRPDAWAGRLEQAVASGAPVPADLLVAYTVAVLDTGAAHSLWRPRLSDADLAAVARRKLLPRVLDGEKISAGVAGDRTLLIALVRAVQPVVADPGRAAALVRGMHPGTADLLLGAAGAESPVGRHAAVVLARHGRADRVEVFRRACRDGRQPLAELGGLVWPDLPTAAEARAALAVVAPAALVEAGLVDRFVQRVLADADAKAIGAETEALAADLVRLGNAAELPRGALDLVGAVHQAGMLRRVRPDEAGPLLDAALQVSERVTPRVRAHVVEIAVSVAVAAETPEAVAVAVSVLFSQGKPDVAPAYHAAVETRLRKVSPRLVAAAVVGWVRLDDRSARKTLLDGTLPAAIAKRGRRDLDAIGGEIARQGKGAHAPGRATWRQWWADWRARHERVPLAVKLVGWVRGDPEKRAAKRAAKKAADAKRKAQSKADAEHRRKAEAAAKQRTKAAAKERAKQARSAAKKSRR